MDKNKTTSTYQTNTIPRHKISLIGIVLLSLFSFTAVAYADSILLELKPEIIYGNDIKIAGMISFDEIKFHRGIPVSMELRDDTGNVIDAQSTPPKQDGSFYYAVSSSKIKEFDGTEKSFTVTVYYGSPNPSLLDTQYSTSDSFKVVKSKENDSVQKTMQKTNDYSNTQPDAVSDVTSNLEIPTYSSDVLMVIVVVVFLLVVSVVLKIVRSRLTWKKAEALAAKANQQTARANIQENYIR